MRDRLLQVEGEPRLGGGECGDPVGVRRCADDDRVEALVGKHHAPVDVVGLSRDHVGRGDDARVGKPGDRREVGLGDPAGTDHADAQSLTRWRRDSSGAMWQRIQ
jgi:hypothetical protein